MQSIYLRKFFLGFSILSWIAFAGPAQAFAQKSNDDSRPNFVIIMADDLGYGDLSCYWSKPPCKTPNLDALAKSGVRFTDFHSSGNVCSPTRAGLLTGLYQQRVGVAKVINADPKVPAHKLSLPHSTITIAEALKAHGYRTALMGKWHLGYNVKSNPLTHGFDEFIGFVSGNIDYHSHYDRMETFDWWEGKAKFKEGGYSTHLITKHAVEFIEKHHEKPFFLYVAHEAVHAPWQGPNDPPQRGPNKEKGKVDKQRALREMLTELDRGVGKIVATLKEHDLDRKTFVFFCSDNGPAGGSSGPLRGRKGSNWEGGHRVPGIASWPGKIPGNKTSKQLAITLDLMPTILDFAAVKLKSDKKLDGVSLKQHLLAPSKTNERELYWNGRAMRSSQWKLMQTGNGKKARFQLFDLNADLGEKKDVSKQHPDRTESMKKKLMDWKREVNPSQQ